MDATAQGTQDMLLCLEQEVKKWKEKVDAICEQRNKLIFRKKKKKTFLENIKTASNNIKILEKKITDEDNDTIFKKVDPMDRSVDWIERSIDWIKRSTDFMNKWSHCMDIRWGKERGDRMITSSNCIFPSVTCIITSVNYMNRDVEFLNKKIKLLAIIHNLKSGLEKIDCLVEACSAGDSAATHAQTAYPATRAPGTDSHKEEKSTG